jgi:hypothetical protein
MSYRMMIAKSGSRELSRTGIGSAAVFMSSA